MALDSRNYDAIHKNELEYVKRIAKSGERGDQL
jgi:hypothetical protein